MASDDMKRFNLVETDYDGISSSMDEHANGEYVLAADHDAALAEKDREIADRKNTFEVLQDLFGEKKREIERQNAEIAELKAKIQRWSDVAPEDYCTPHEHYLQVELATLRAEVAEQAKLSKWQFDEMQAVYLETIAALRAEIAELKQENLDYKDRLSDVVRTTDRELETARRVLQQSEFDRTTNLKLMAAEYNEIILKQDERIDNLLTEREQDQRVRELLTTQRNLFMDNGYGTLKCYQENLEDCDAEIAAIERKDGTK